MSTADDALTLPVLVATWILALGTGVIACGCWLALRAVWRAARGTSVN